MAQPTYLESFLESVDDLPNDLQRKLQLIRELDEQSQGLVESIEKSAEDYMQLRKKPKQTEDAGMLRQIRKDQKTVVDLGDEKVALAVQVYELIDVHIQRLDADLKKFEDDLKLTDGGDSKQGKRKNNKVKEEGGSGRGASNKKMRESVVDAGNIDLDLPIDPNEPTYCTCHRVSFGEMIACDNPTCELEWFHFDCVNYVPPPAGQTRKWFCPDCSTLKKKGLLRI